MKKYAFATITASALAALSIGLVAPAMADPSDPGSDTDGTNQTDSQPGTTAQPGYSNAGKTPYGTYQNDDKKAGSTR